MIVDGKRKEKETRLSSVVSFTRHLSNAIDLRSERRVESRLSSLTIFNFFRSLPCAIAFSEIADSLIIRAPEFWNGLTYDSDLSNNNDVYIYIYT